MGRTQACAAGGAPDSYTVVMLRGRSSGGNQLFILILRAGFSLHCLSRDLAAKLSSEGRYAWTALVQHGARWLSRLPHGAPVSLRASSGVLPQKNTAYKPERSK